jgi:excisionase family DNA binding protein
MNLTPVLLSKRHAAEMMGISLRTLDDLINRKQLTVIRIGRRVLVPRKVLERLADGQGLPVDPA